MKKDQFKYRSAKRTDTTIKTAFAELLLEKKSLNKISVAELARRSGITRGTFYAHYNNVADVALSIEDELVDALNVLPKDAVSEAANPNVKRDAKESLTQLFEFLKKNSDLYTTLLRSETPMIFINRLNVSMHKKLSEALKDYIENHPMAELNISFYTDGATYMVLHYFRGDLSMSLDEIEWYLGQRFTEMFA